MVFVLHYGGGAESSFLPLRAIGIALHYGWAGVSLFFVLSGFLISGILWESFSHPGWWKRFVLRRSLRIFPLYYLAILIAFVVEVSVHSSFKGLQGFWIYILYLRDLPSLSALAETVTGTIRLGHFWSLAVEEQFYLFWPFILAIFAGKRRQAIRMILSLWALSFLFRLAMLRMHVPAEWGTEFLFGRAGELLAGAYLAMAVRGEEQETQRLFRSLPAVLALSSLAWIAVAFLSRGTQPATPWMSTLGLALLGIFFAGVVGSSLHAGLIHDFFDTPLLRWLGKISYGIYVYHLLLHDQFVWATDRIAPTAGHNARFGLLFMVALMGTLGAASLSYYTFERAFLRWKQRISD